MFKIFISALLVLCGFCHAPESAYDELAELTEADPYEFCPHASQRFEMARTPRPQSDGRVQYAWDEYAHAWVEERVRTTCLLCGNAYLKPAYPWEAWTFCTACRPRALTRIRALLLFFGGERLSRDECEDIRSPPRARHYLLFNDVPIWTTRGLDEMPTRRAWWRITYPPELIVGVKPARVPQASEADSERSEAAP